MSKFYTNVSVNGNHVYYRGVENGRRVQRKISYAPTLFIPSKTRNLPIKYHDLQGNPVEPMEFPSIYDAKNHLKKYEEVEGFITYGQTRFEYVFIADEHPEESLEWDVDQVVTAFIDIEVDTEHSMPDMVECQNPVNAITVKFSNDPSYYVFGCKTYAPHRNDIEYQWCENEIDLLDRFLDLWKVKYPDIVSGWNVKTFDIPYLVGRLVGLTEFGEEAARWLSPWGKILAKEDHNFHGKTQRTYQLLGISTLDYLQLFRKYAPNAAQESYKLDHIAHVELKERKVSYAEYETLHNLYRDNFQKFIEYNIHDVELVEQLNAKGRLIEMSLTLAYDNKTNYEDCLSQVRMWDCICYNHLRRKGIVLPPMKHTGKDQAYEGAYVKDPQLGLHEWVASFDLNSLYPHLIMQYNLSPETIIDKSHYTDVQKQILNDGVTVDRMLQQQVDLSDLTDSTITPNGQFFTTRLLGFLPEIMQKMYNDRVVYKKKMLSAQKEKEGCEDPARRKELDAIISRFKNLQLAKKVGLNSAYGAMGSEYFRFFDTRIAEAVTLAGQLSIRWIENKLNDFMNGVLKTNQVDYVLASDTDSVYLNLSPMVHKVFKDTTNTTKVINFIDKLCEEKFQPFIDQSYQYLAEYVHAHEQKMQMKRESLVDKAIWTAKKRYILNVWDQEGVRYREPKMVIHGLEAIKSSTPQLCRDKIKEALKIILNGTESQLIDYIEAFKVEFKQLPIGDIAFPRGMNGLEDYQNKEGISKMEFSYFCGYNEPIGLGSKIYNSGTPIHVKGALVYNHHLKRLGLSDKYELIRSGEKLKFVYLKEPNVFNEHVMSFLVRIPEEFHLETCVNYDLMFEKTFLDPLNIVLNCIGWHSEHTANLEDLFS